MATPCLVDKDWGTTTGKFYDWTDSPSTIVELAWKSLSPYRTAIGIAKDGRPIYSLLKSNGQLYSECELDICNGLYINGHYSYVATKSHPYIMGCFGPGISPQWQAQCTSNPKKICTASVSITDAVTKGALSLVASSSLLLLSFLI